MTKSKMEKEEDATGQEFKVTPAADAQLAVPDTDARIRAVTTPTVVGVPEATDDEVVEEFVVWLQAKAEEANADTMQYLAEAIRKAQTAETVADALKEPLTASSKDVLDRPFLAHGFHINEGQYEDSELPFFASIEAEFKDLPERIILNTGAYKILAVLRALDGIGQWPLPLVFVGKGTRKGRTVISLKYLG